jgi:hypothetical protein
MGARRYDDVPRKTMNTRTKRIAAALVLAAAAGAVNAQSAGSTPPSGTSYQAERNLASTSVAPVPFPLQTPVVTPTPARSAGDFSNETARQAAENRWFALERQRGSGNVAPVPYPPIREGASAFESNGGVR